MKNLRETALSASVACCAVFGISLAAEAALVNSKVPNFHPSMTLRLEEGVAAGTYPLITGISSINLDYLRSHLTVVPSKYASKVELLFENNTVYARVRGGLMIIFR